LGDDPVGGQDLAPAVHAQFADQQAKERLGFLRVGFGDDRLELVGDRGQLGGRWRLVTSWAAANALRRTIESSTARSCRTSPEAVGNDSRG